MKVSDALAQLLQPTKAVKFEVTVNDGDPKVPFVVTATFRYYAAEAFDANPDVEGLASCAELAFSTRENLLDLIHRGIDRELDDLLEVPE